MDCKKTQLSPNVQLTDKGGRAHKSRGSKTPNLSTPKRESSRGLGQGVARGRGTPSHGGTSDQGPPMGTTGDSPHGSYCGFGRAAHRGGSGNAAHSSPRNRGRGGWQQSPLAGNGGRPMGNPRINQTDGSEGGGAVRNQFAPYMPLAEMKRRGFASQNIGPGSLIEGIIRINPKSYEDAFVCASDGASDILIKGIRNRNRSLHGDAVIIEVLPKSEWVVQHETVQDFLQMSGTEADHRILQDRAIFNIKQETDGATSQPDDHSLEQSISSIDVTIQLDAYSSPSPRGPDTVSVLNEMTLSSSTAPRVKGVDAAVKSDGWGSGQVGSGLWDTTGVRSNAAANSVLAACMLEEERLCEDEGKKLIGGLSRLSVTELAVDLPPDLRVKVERGGQPVLVSDLLVPPQTDYVAKTCSEEEEIEGGVAMGEAEGSSLEEAEESDYESDESMEADLDQRIEDEAFRLANLGLDPEEEWARQMAEEAATPEESEPNNSEPAQIESEEDDGPDVVVESSTVDEDEAVAVANEDKSHAEARKRTRRGRRRPKKSATNAAVNGEKSDNALAAVATKSESPAAKGAANLVYGRRPPKVAMVEYATDSVLAHPRGEEFVQRTGRVVNIVEFKHSRIAAGSLKIFADRNPNFALFCPSDSRFPRMKIPMAECPPNFLQRFEDYASTIFVAKLLEWETVNSARGQLIKSLGDSSDIEVRVEGLLLEHSIDASDFTPEVVADLPANHATWSIPPEELAARRDFRSECVFTIDPLTARDLDDALSVIRLEDGNYRVAVHIADVSYFIAEGSALDLAAADRATSTYLVHKVIPMLPRPLCENLCSLNPGEDRLCYSVEWTMSPEGDILAEWFGRTVIRSCVKLAYEHAQSLIDQPTKTDWREGELPTIESPYTSTTISEKVNLLQRLAVKLRGKRESEGYLRLDQGKLAFTLDPATGMPDGFRLQERWQSNKLIEEFMLLANIAVAKRIHSAFPTLAVLRRHPPPKKFMLDKTVAQMKALGLDIASESAASLGACIARFGSDTSQALLHAGVTCLLSKTIELAQYFCSGMFNEPDYHHYALNVPFYTHFTSPIRRYPDIMVHRLLEYAVKGEKPDWKTLDIQNQALHCNDKKLLAKRAGEASSELFLALFISQSGPLTQVGCVVSVFEYAVDVLLVELGLVRRVYMDRLDINSFKVRRLNTINYLDLVWKNGRRQTLTTFSQVELALHKGERPFDFITLIQPPDQETNAATAATITID